MKINPENLQTWLAKTNFAEHGDKLERSLYKFLHEEFQSVEDFWRKFVVPLTTRLLDYPKPTKPSVSFRPEIDELLQHICSANYSVFVHLAIAKRELSKWNDEQSLETVYLRISSAFDVFESLCFSFAKLLDQCRGTGLAGLEKLSQQRIVEIAASYAEKRYSKSFEKFLTKGQAVTIRLHNLDSVLAQCFSSIELFGKYKTHSAAVRRMRNALVHDLRLGQIADEHGKILIPRPAAVDRYRSWSEILAASKSPETVKADFNEPFLQAEIDLGQTLRLLNELYHKLLGDFDSEFHRQDRSQLRERFHITFCESSEEQSTAEQHGQINLGTAVNNFGRSLTAELAVSDFPVPSAIDDITAASGVAITPKKTRDYPLILNSGTAPLIPPDEEPPGPLK